jgi:hypothetical protein
MDTQMQTKGPKHFLSEHKDLDEIIDFFSNKYSENYSY